MDKESWRRGGDSRPAPRGQTSFDELAKELAEGKLSRRNALRWIGGTLVGSLLASIPGVALATPQGEPPGGQNCPPGRDKCQGDCVDRSSDSNHCGQCRNICSQSQVCENGTCVSASPPPAACTPGTSCGPLNQGRCCPNSSGGGSTCACSPPSFAPSCLSCPPGTQACVSTGGLGVGCVAVVCPQ
jgi:hypothetical protein